MNIYKLKFITSYREISYRHCCFTPLFQVVFFPSFLGVSQQTYTIFCDNYEVKDVTVTGLFLTTFRDLIPIIYSVSVNGGRWLEVTEAFYVIGLSKYFVPW